MTSQPRRPLVKDCFKLFLSNFLNDFYLILGCKIKALRAKTNTYIKTPVRGEEPVFVVTGRKEDVSAAKREILSAADHFSQIRYMASGVTNCPRIISQFDQLF